MGKVKPTDAQNRARLKYRLGMLVKLIEQDAPDVILWSQTDLLQKSFRRVYGTRTWRGTKRQIIGSWLRWNIGGGKRRMIAMIKEEDEQL